MENEEELKIMEPIKPIAMCGVCCQRMYLHAGCQSPSVHGARPDCPMNGEEWRQMKNLLDMRNTYVR